MPPVLVTGKLEGIIMENRKYQSATGFGHRQAGNNYYEHYTQSLEPDLGILGEIIEFVLEEKIPENFRIEYAEALSHEIELQLKIPLNTDNTEDADDLRDMFVNHWGMIMTVAKYLGDIEDQGKVIRLREYIKSQYRTIRLESNSVIQIFDKLPFTVLPREKASNPDYNVTAKSIVLYFFEQCDIGKKTAKEKEKKLL
jgi:hypothetical protein